VTNAGEIMATKLTLTLDKKIIKAVKEYAKNNNISLSGILELYFKTLSVCAGKIKIGPITRQLSGMINLSNEKPDKIILSQEIYLITKNWT
jgi:hypothetical protein